MPIPIKIFSFNAGQWNPTPTEFQALLSVLPLSDQTRIMRFHFIADRKRATATCLLIRLMIQALMPSINVKDIEIDRTEFGRPFLKHPAPPDGLDFNASHHGDFCIVVGCIGSRVGIDVMKVELNPTETVDNFLSIFQDYQVTPAEWSSINSCSWGPRPGWARLHSFFRLWCMKESYTKTLGLGLGLDFKTIEFRESDSAIWKDKDGSLDVFNEAITVVENGIQQPGWFFHLAYLDKYHPYCVAIEKGSDVEAFCGITEIPAFEVSVFQRSQ